MSARKKAVKADALAAFLVFRRTKCYRVRGQVESQEFQDPTAKKIAAFLSEIGISVRAGLVRENTFLPGIDVIDGGLVVDESRLLYPGDLLHEAGHLAVAPAAARSHLNGEVELPDEPPHVVELASICWSYAACLHIGLDPRVVFHEHGYHGRSESLLRNFEFGVYLGVSSLENEGMTLSPAVAGSEQRPFPVMQKWLRD